MIRAKHKTTKSKWVKVGKSGIHGRGLSAKRDIPEDTRMIEYVGEKITKKESERRRDEHDEVGRKSGGGVVYVFVLNKRYDIDGAVYWNDARHANHSCDPNSYVDIVKGRIWLIAGRDIKKGEEIVYDYNFEAECYEDHPCGCGARMCVGYIVGEEERGKLKKILARKKAKKKAESAKKKSRKSRKN